VDSYGGETRNPLFIDPVSPYDILTTNNFFKYQGANPEALLPGSYRPGIEADNDRCKAMLEKAEAFESEGQTIQIEQMIEILRAGSRPPRADSVCRVGSNL